MHGVRHKKNNPNNKNGNTQTHGTPTAYVHSTFLWNKKKLCPMKTIVSALSIFGEKNGPSADVVSITWLTTRFTVTPTKHKLWSGFRNYPHKPK